MPQPATRIPLLVTARVSTASCLSVRATFRLNHRVYQTVSPVFCPQAYDLLHAAWPCSSSSSSSSLASRPRRAPISTLPFSTSSLHTAMGRRARSKTPQPQQQPQQQQQQQLAAKQQTRDHSGHSHGHGHGHHHHHGTNEFLTSTNKNDAGVRITRIGLYVNLGMAVAKFIGGYYFNSKALLADAIHSLTDLVSDVMTLATVSWSLEPPSARFPAGYGKVESLGSLGVSGILLGSGVLMGYAALSALLLQFVPGAAEAADAIGLHAGHAHSHSHSHTDLGPNINAMWLAGASIAIKEWLYRATLAVARERKSSVLASNAYHHRVDSLTALVALVLIGASNVLHNAAWLDPVGGLVISLMIVQAGWANTRESLLELADAALDTDVAQRVRAAAETSLPAGASVRSVAGVKAGQVYLVDVELGVPGSWAVGDASKAEAAVRTAVGAGVRGVKRVRVRFVPADGAGALPPSVLDEFVPPEVSARASPPPDDGAAQANGHAHKH